ncbi:hypothetical protein BC832DRAFT_595869 [Gaertneriomyces semiglobifer]|nr:hypothetical protein BC832DRAFT_595869 [Gaertneriomyces semiglobifer]
MQDPQEQARIVANNYLRWLAARTLQEPNVSTAVNADRLGSLQLAHGERQLLQKLQGALATIEPYEDVELQDRAREQIPVDKLHEEAALAAETGEVDFQDCLVIALMRWFRNDYFSWMNEPSCIRCRNSTINKGQRPPEAEDLKYGCSRVEVYHCASCDCETLFPRYNDPVKLMETRTGRCGEWANLFCLFCKSMGFDTRYVLDLTDHVWTEVYSDAAKRWIHCDSCETAFDRPLLYEAGWGKKLNYVFAFNAVDVVDVTRRYSRKMEDVLTRRTLISEERLKEHVASLKERQRASLSPEVIVELEQRDREEEHELANPAPRHPDTGELVGRTSGDVQWRAARGELG